MFEIETRLLSKVYFYGLYLYATMHRTTLRLLIALIFVALVGGILGYSYYHRKSGASDILGMQGVAVCSTARDFSSGGHRCPTNDQSITTCDQAKQAVGGLEGIKLQSQINQVTSAAATQPVECELRTVSQSDGLYALVVHAYYPVISDGGSKPLSDGGERSKAIAALYGGYSNFYQSYLALDLTTTSLSQGVSQPGLFQALTTAFLVKGEPGFRMSVQVIDENGATHPGGSSLITVSCGASQDTMVTEGNGNSWFSFAGYEKLQCGTQPLTAQVQVQKDENGRWISGTPSYNYLYAPTDPTVISFQNRPEPARLAFAGSWQGVGTQVSITSYDVTGAALSTPLPGMAVAFSCSDPTTSLVPPVLARITDKKGKAIVGLADAQNDLSGCTQDKVVVKLANYDPAKPKKDDPGYDYYFGTPGPMPAGTVTAATLTNGTIQGQRLELGGSVRIADVGKTPGGFLTNGSRICLFLTPEAVSATAGCPDSNGAKVLTTTADSNGRYVFGNDGSTHLSYGDYLAAGSSKVQVRIINYKGAAYPPDIVDNNTAVLSLDSFSQRDIHLPATEGDLHDDICQAVLRVWGTTKECDPLFNIIEHESGWTVAATNSSSGACGLFQANPCNKYQSTALTGEPYQAIGNQIRWGVQYVKARYGTPSKAWVFWQANKHY